MNNKIIDLLEVMRNQSKVKYEDYINKEDVALIMEWYNRNLSFNESALEKAARLMLWFYEHENFDLYEVSVFKSYCKMISESYEIDENDVLYKFIEFKKLVFKD